MALVEKIRHYFVDESGDPVLFDRRGRILIGNQGCSRYFILGFIDVSDPQALTREMTALRQRFLEDPYFRGVPSMQPAQKKTAVCFHAKDDLPEVRRDVFAALIKQKIRFHATVRDKREVLAWAHQRREAEPGYRYKPNELYDSMVRRLFKEHLHKAEEHRICFARRGHSDRTASLAASLGKARARFTKQWRKEIVGSVVVTAANARDKACLQAADYCLWALQRLYERGEDRYVRYIWDCVGVVHDVDDRRQARYGAYYNAKRPLSAAVVKQEPRDIG